MTPKTIISLVLLLSLLSTLGMTACFSAPGTASEEDSLAAAEKPPAMAADPVALAHEPAALAQQPPAATTPTAEPLAWPVAFSPAAASPATGRDFQAEAPTYIHYYRTIGLTPEQEAIKNEALSKIPAPCCSENSLATCCCPCNMAKAAWGLSAYLIVHEGYDAPRLEQAMRDWLGAINPNGFRGDACTNGGCARPVHRDGCGGMHEDNVL